MAPLWMWRGASSRTISLLVLLVVGVVLQPARRALVVHVVPVGVRFARGLAVVHVLRLVGVDDPRFVTRVRDEVAGDIVQIAPVRHDRLLSTQGWLHLSLECMI